MRELVLINTVVCVSAKSLCTSVVLSVLLWACSSRPLPDLPQVDAARFQPDVRRAIQQALEGAKGNSKDVERTLDLCRVLHAHDQFQAAAQCYSRADVISDEKRFDVLYLWGIALAAEGSYPAAAERLRQAVQINPGSIPAQLKLADVLRESGAAEQSARIYRDVLEKNPQNARAYYGLGRALGGDAAVAEFQKAIEWFPRYGAAQFALAAAYRREGNEAKAQEVLRDYERDKTLLPPLDDPEMAKVSSLNVSPSALMQRASEQELEGRLDQAVAMYERAIAGDPKLVEAHVGLISLYGRLGRENDVEKSYRRALELNADNADAHYNFGVFSFAKRRIPEARSAFERALKSQPNHAESLHNLGAILEGEGKLDQAAAFYRRALESKPVYPLAHFHLGRIYANQGRYAQALKEFEASLEPAGESTPAYMYALAATYARAGNRARAVELMRTARTEAQARGQQAVVASIDRDVATLERRQ